MFGFIYPLEEIITARVCKYTSKNDVRSRNGKCSLVYVTVHAKRGIFTYATEIAFLLYII